MKICCLAGGISDNTINTLRDEPEFTTNSRFAMLAFKT